MPPGRNAAGFNSLSLARWKSSMQQYAPWAYDEQNIAWMTSKKTGEREWKSFTPRMREAIHALPDDYTKIRTTGGEVTSLPWRPRCTIIANSWHADVALHVANAVAYQIQVAVVANIDQSDRCSGQPNRTPNHITKHADKRSPSETGSGLTLVWGDSHAPPCQS